MLIQHIALVPDVEGVDASELARVSAALQKQVTRDLGPIWGIAATVDAFPYLEDVPIGYWPIVLTFTDLGSHEGVQLDRNGQPFAQIQLAQDWSLAASRACLDMLVNPFERRAVTAPSLRSEQGPVEFMIEACGACEDPRHAYTVNDVLVSDFCTPAFFVAEASHGGHYSFGGSLEAPLRLRAGGHLTWYDAISGSHWLRSHWGDNPTDTQLGTVDRRVTSVRELVSACAQLRLRAQLRSPVPGQREHARSASRFRAQRLRALFTDPLDAALDAAIEAVRLDRGEARRPGQPLVVQLSSRLEARGEAEWRQEPAAVAAAPAPAAAASEDYASVEIEEFEEVDTAAAARVPSVRPSPSLPPSMVSLAPTVLDVQRDRPAPRKRTVLAGALAAAGLLAIVWSARGPHGTPQAQRSAAAPAHPPLSKAAAAAAMMPPPVAPKPPAAGSAEPTPSAAPSAPQAQPRHAGAARAETKPAAAPATARSEQAAAERPRTPRHAASDLPSPSPEPLSRESANLSVDDLIETRR